MSFDEAYEAEVSFDEACRELRAHGHMADFDPSTGELFDCESGDTIAMPGRDGLYPGADVLAWLGY